MSVLKTGNESFLPSRIGSYIVETLIESNAYHECYRGFDPVKKIPVFIKRLTPQAQQSEGPAKDHFSREIRILRTLNHPNLSTMLQAGMEGGRPYLVCPYILGVTLRQFLIQELPRPSESLSIIRQIASALSYLHTKQIIHNDLKPENILITPNLESVLIDFSIAARLGGHQDLKVNQLAGTLLYMSPERQSQSAATSIASDLYSFAIICYELLTGHLSHGMIQLANLPTPLQPIFARGLQNDPKLRYQSVDDFVIEIERHKDSLAGLHLPLRRKKSDLQLIDANSQGTVLRQAELESVFIPSSSFEGEGELLSCGCSGQNSSLCMIRLQPYERQWLYYLKGQIDGFDSNKWKSENFTSWLDHFAQQRLGPDTLVDAAWIEATSNDFHIWLHGSMLAICLQPDKSDKPFITLESTGPWKNARLAKTNDGEQKILFLPKAGLSSELILREILTIKDLCFHDLYAFCHVASRRLADLSRKLTPQNHPVHRVAIPTLGLMPSSFSVPNNKKVLLEGKDKV